MKKIYKIGDLTIDLRKFYQVWIDENNEFNKVGWSAEWWCLDNNCGCGDDEHVKKHYPDARIRLVPWYIRCIKLSRRDFYTGLIFGIILAIIL